jgi:hypothetical protein
VTPEPSGNDPTTPAITEPTGDDPLTEASGEQPVGAYRNLPPVTERELAARARGLDSAYIDGGEDPDIEETRRREAKYWRLLIGMIVVIVGGGLLVTFVGIIVAGNGG